MPRPHTKDPPDMHCHTFRNDPDPNRCRHTHFHTGRVHWRTPRRKSAASKRHSHRTGYRTSRNVSDLSIKRRTMRRRRLARSGNLIQNRFLHRWGAIRHRDRFVRKRIQCCQVLRKMRRQTSDLSSWFYLHAEGQENRRTAKRSDLATHNS